MKKITSLIVLFLSTLVGISQETYYYEGEEIMLNRIENRIYVTLEKGITIEERDAIINAVLVDYNFEVDEQPEGILELNPWKREHVTLTYNEPDVENVIEQFKSFSTVKYVENIFTYENSGFESGITNEILLRKTEGISNDDFFDAVADLGCVVTIESNNISGQFLVECSKDVNVFLKARQFYELGIFMYAEPNFVYLDALTTSDPYYVNQWPLLNTGQSGGTFGADIDGGLAHNITYGRPEIKIAIVDEGVDLSHPDLDDNLLQGFDATGGNNQGSHYGPHGTACAGLAAAEADNGGIAGVAPNCSIIPVAMSAFTPFQMSNGIKLAAKDGKADIISNSWGGGQPVASVNMEIDWATNSGRNGLGCVVVFASGNSAAVVSGVAWPSSLPKVISVGALDHNGDRTNYSQFGPNLDVTAPGGDRDIWTTDIQGFGTNTGYNNIPTDGDYTDNFDGTSAACPHVAGVAALVLSVNPCLTNTQVEEVIERTCDKTGSGHVFCPNTNGNWTPEVGYGRVNANKAVKLALDYEHKATFNGTTNTLVTTYPQWVLLNSCNGSLPSAHYFNVEMHKVEATFNIPYSPAAGFSIKTNGILSGNPNTGAQFATISNTNGTQVTASTYVYFIKQNALGQTLDVWYPVSPTNVTFDINPHNIGPYYFQNRTETQLTNTYRNNEPIYAGENVTSLVPVGKYRLQSNNNITFISKKYISLEPGFVIDNANQNVFEARIGGFNRCNDYPNGLYKTKENGSDTVKEVIIAESKAPYKYYNTKEQVISKQSSYINSKVKLHPNPNNGSFKITLPSNSIYHVRVLNILGSSVHSVEFDGQQTEIQLDGKLPSGTYTVQIDGGGIRHVERITVTR